MTDLKGVHDYAYDELYQLLGATHPLLPTESFGYDPNGNRLGTVVDGGNRLLEDANFRYGYDDNGNMIVKVSRANGAVTNYDYDAENRLIGVTTSTSNISYNYDPFGRRIQKDVNGAQVKYVYDGEDIVLEYNTADELIASYLHGPGIDEPISLHLNGNSFYYHFDGLGSVTAMTDTNGNKVQSYEYDSFGNITDIGNPFFNQPYTYTGREYDPETGLYYYRARYYDATIGRFISEDPIGFAAGDVNLYRYVGNRPLYQTDPMGRNPIIIVGVATAVVTTAYTAYQLYKMGKHTEEGLDNVIKANEKLKNSDFSADDLDEAIDYFDKAITNAGEAGLEGAKCPGTSAGGPLSGPSR